MIELKEHWTPTQADFDAFAAVSGDNNAIHVNPDFCARTAFGRTVSHGMLLYTKLWGMLKRYDPDLVFELQTLMFPNPAFAGEALDLCVTEDRRGHLDMRVSRSAGGDECLIGEAEYTC